MRECVYYRLATSQLRMLCDMNLCAFKVQQLKNVQPAFLNNYR